MLNQAAKFGPVVVLGLLRRSNSLDFENGPTEVRNDDPTVRTFFYINISRYMRNQPLRFHHIAISDILNTINGLDLDCGADKVGFHNKNLLLPGYCSIAFQRLWRKKIRRGR